MINLCYDLFASTTENSLEEIVTNINFSVVVNFN